MMGRNADRQARPFWPHDAWVAALVCLPLLTTIISRINETLDLDETLTFFVSRGSLSEVSASAAAYQGQSPLYYLIASVFLDVFGTSEAALRLPTVLALCTIPLVLHGVFTRKEAGLCAAVIFTAFLPWIPWVCDARPYSLALLFLLLTVRLFQAWGHGGGSARWSGWVLCSVLTLETVFLSAPFLVLLPSLVGRAKMRWRGYLAGISVVVVAVALLSAPQLQQIAERSRLYSFAPIPTASALFAAIGSEELRLFVLITALAWAAQRLIGHESVFHRLRGAAPVLSVALLWWIFPLLSLFLLSRILHLGLFVPRYYFWSLAGSAAFIGVLLSRLDRRPRLAACTAIACIAATAEAMAPAQSGYREVVTAVNARCASRPVLVQPMLIESTSTEWLAQRRDYLLGPFHYYPLEGAREIVLLPYQLTPANAPSWREPIVSLAGNGGDGICLIRGQRQNRHDALPALLAELQELGMSYQPIAVHGEIEAGIFLRRAP